MNSERVLNGRYEVGELIGRGGMADVYLARDILLGRSVAVKVLRRDLARDPLFQSRFQREAKAVAALNHPAIVSIFDTGNQDMPQGAAHDEVIVPFIVMEYVAGRTIRDLIKSRDIGIDDAVHHSLGILAALEYSHQAGIVHRDIKPANVMITPAGAIKVMDFGIARAMADSAATMTQTQAVLGTAQYLSPEQARGDTVDARSDLYSAACLLYEMLVGRPPFVGESPVSVAYQHVRELPEPPSTYNPKISEALDSVLAKALQKDRADRFQDASEFRVALEDARRGVVTAPAGADAHPATETMGTVHPVGNDTGELDPEFHTRAMERVSGRRAGAGNVGATRLSPGDDDEPPHENVPPALAFGSSGKRDPEHRKRRRAWIVTLFLALALILAAGGYLFFQLANQPKEPITQAVPVVAEMTENEAQNAIYGANLIPQVDQEFHGKVPEGTVIGSRPGAGEQVAPDSTVTLIVSKGPASAVIPKDLAGQTEPAARDSLQRLGLVTGETTTANSPDVPAGRLLATEPGLGEEVPVNSTVNLIISTGLVTVPNVVDMPREQAGATLTDPAVNLLVEFQEQENAVVKPGTVTAQNLPAGTETEPGTVVELTVAKAPAKPTKTPTPDATPTTEPGQSGEPTPSPSPSPSEKPDTPEPSEKPDTPEPSEKPGKPDNPGKPDSPGKPDNPGKP